MHRKTIAVDFDGVIHSYDKGWQDGSIYGTVVEGCREALQRLLDNGCDVVVYSTRSDAKEVNGKLQSGQLAEMHRWLTENNVPFSCIHHGVGKPLAWAFIDDRAIHFNNWNQALCDLRTMGMQL